MKGWKQSKRVKVRGWKTRNRYWHGSDGTGLLAATALLMTSLFKRRR